MNKQQTSPPEDDRNPIIEGVEIHKGTPPGESDGPTVDHDDAPQTTDELVSRVPSYEVRQEIRAGAGIGYRLIVFATFLIFGVYLLLQWISRITVVLEIFTIGMLLAMAVNPLVKWLASRGVPRIASVLTMLLLLATIFIAAGAILGPQLIEELSGLYQDLPNIYSRLNVYVARLEDAFPRLDVSGLADQIQTQGRERLDDLLGAAQTLFTASITTLFQSIIVLFILVFILVDPDPLIRGLRSIMPDRWQPEVQRIGMLAVGKVEAWLQGTLLLMLAVGALNTLAFWWLGVPYFLLWGVLAGLLEIIPTVGPVIAAVPPIIVGLTVSPSLALKVAGAALVIQQMENNLLVPLIMSNKVRLHPITLLFFLLVMAQFLGIFGALIATPLAAVLKVLYMELYYRRVHGTLPEDEAEDPIRMKILHRFAKKAHVGDPPGPPAK